MNKEFIPYEQALELKELGFDDVCLSFYNGKFLDSTDYNFDDGTSKDVGLCINAPLKQQVFRWFREKYGLYHIIHCASEKIALFTITNMINEPSVHTDRHIETYEEAEDACIDKLIEIAKQQDNGE